MPSARALKNSGAEFTQTLMQSLPELWAEFEQNMGRIFGRHAQRPRKSCPFCCLSALYLPHAADELVTQSRLDADVLQHGRHEGVALEVAAHLLEV